MTQLDGPRSGDLVGRGGATGFQQDLQNADCIVIMGSNMAECHPVGFQWVMEAKLRGAKIVHVDPRFTRTSALASRYVPIRAGSDIAFLGGIVHHILENGREFRDYVVNYTNAPVIINEDFKDSEDLDGFFSGWDRRRAAMTTPPGSTRGCASAAPSRTKRPRSAAKRWATAATGPGSSTASLPRRTRRSSTRAACSSS